MQEMAEPDTMTETDKRPKIRPGIDPDQENEGMKEEATEKRGLTRATRTERDSGIEVAAEIGGDPHEVDILKNFPFCALLTHS